MIMSFFKKTNKRTVPNASSEGNGDHTIDYGNRVRKIAYELYERRGYVHGHELEDWLEAEKIIKEEISKK